MVVYLYHFIDISLAEFISFSLVTIPIPPPPPRGGFYDIDCILVLIEVS